MAQTERATAEINALLADNASRDISPQDMRDAVGTSMGGYAGIVLTIGGAGAVKSSVAQTPIVITEFDVVSAQSVDVNTGGCSANATTGQITVGAAGIYYVSFYSSFSLSANNKVVHFQPFKNGSVGIVEVDRFVGTGTDVGVVAMHGVIPYAEADVVEVRVFIDAGTADVTFESLGLSLFRVG